MEKHHSYSSCHSIHFSLHFAESGKAGFSSVIKKQYLKFGYLIFHLDLFYFFIFIFPNDLARGKGKLCLN